MPGEVESKIMVGNLHQLAEQLPWSSIVGDA